MKNSKQTEKPGKENLPGLSISKPSKKKKKKPKSKIRNIFINLLLIMGSSVFAFWVIFIAGEIWIRSQELPETTGSIYTIRENAHPRAVLTPGALETATGTQVQINSLGFRGPEYSREKPEGTLRVIALGDSFTFGAGAPQEVLFTTRLEEKLNQTKKYSPAEVLNFGVVDYNTDDELALLKEKGLELSPDVVLLFYVMNDIEVKSEYLPKKEETEAVKKGVLNEEGQDRQYRAPLYWIVHNLRQRSHFLAYLAPRVAALGRNLGFDIPSSGAFYSTAYAENVEGWQRSKAALKKIQALGEKHGFEFALILFPLMTNFTDSYPAKRSHEVIAQFANEQGIPFLDLLPEYMGKNATSLWVSPTDGHPNAEGHRIAADAVYNFLINHPELLSQVQQ